MSGLLGMIVGVYIFEILDVALVGRVPNRQKRLDRPLAQAAEINRGQDQFGRSECICRLASRNDSDKDTCQSRRDFPRPDLEWPVPRGLVNG